MNDQRIEPKSRRTLSWLMALSGVIGAYLLIERAGFGQTVLLFIGLPVLLGLLVVNLTRAAGVYGRTTRMTFVFLCLVAPLLGEGAVCVIMAAPLFIAMALIGTAIGGIGTGKHKRRTNLLLLLPWPVAGAFQVVTSPPLETVTTRTWVAGSAADWVERVQGVPSVQDSWSPFLHLGFPLPADYQASLNGAQIDFAHGDSPAGFWKLDTELAVDGIEWTLVRDTTKISHWLRLEDSRVQVRSLGGRTQIVHTTRFEPLLYPMSYFVPAERWAIAAGHELAINCWREP